MSLRFGFTHELTGWAFTSFNSLQIIVWVFLSGPCQFLPIYGAYFCSNLSHDYSVSNSLIAQWFVCIFSILLILSISLYFLSGI